MKAFRSICTLAALLATLATQLNAAGDPPDLMSYQGYLVDANGVPLGTDGAGASQPANYDVVFSLYVGPSGGSPLWAEQQTITVDNGYFSVLLGEGTAHESDPTGPISAAFLGTSADERYIGISVRFEVGGEFTDILPRLRMLSSPYSFLSSQARSLVNPDGQKLITLDGGDVTVAGTLTTTQALTAPSVSGSGAGLTNLNANNITTGTLNDARLSGNVVRGNVTTVFTAGQQFNGPNSFYGTNSFFNTVSLGDNHLRLRGNTDFNHGLGWFGSGRTFGGYSPDGPVLWGLSGGGLATINGNRAMTWDNVGRAFFNEIYFGSVTRQHLNLWSNSYGLGVQSSTLYFRTGNSFAWHVNGSHSNNYADAGGGTRTMLLDSGGSLSMPGYLTNNYIHWINTGSSLGSSELRFQQSNGHYGFMWYSAGSGAFRGGNRRIFIGGSGGSTQMSNGTSWASYDGDGNWDFASDERLKDSIQDAEAMLDKVLDVRIRRFRYKDQDGDNLHIGVIAQELEPHFPDLVTDGYPGPEGQSYKMVAYTDFGLIAVAALQELHQRQALANDELRAENAELRSRLAALEAAVNSLLQAQGQ